MSALGELLNAPDVASERIMERGEAVAAESMRIESPLPHSPGSLATPEATETASRPGAAADSGIDTPSELTPTIRQKVKGARRRITPHHVLLLQGVAVLRAMLLTKTDTLPPGVDPLAPPPATLSEVEVKELTLRFLFGDPSGAKATGSDGAARLTTTTIIAAAATPDVAASPPAPHQSPPSTPRASAVYGRSLGGVFLRYMASARRL